MKASKWEVNLSLQPTNNTCGYTALAILLSHYNMTHTPEDLVAKVPQPTDEKGEPSGSITAQLVNWCQQNGLETHMYTSDVFITDLSWMNLSEQEIVERLRAVRSVRNMPVLGEHWSKVYVDAYVDMISNGAKLSVIPFIRTSLLYELLEKGPVYANIGSTANTGKGRTRTTGLRESEVDDINGTINTHSLVIYGNDEDGSFLVADPWDGLVTIDPEQMVLAIQAAQIESDNQIFVVINH